MPFQHQIGGPDDPNSPVNKMISQKLDRIAGFLEKILVELARHE